MTDEHDTAARNTGQELPDPETLLPGNPFPAMQDAFAPPENEIAPQGHTPGPWSYRPLKYDDWSYVRGPIQDDGFEPFICQAKDYRAMDEEILNQHRRNGTDPWEENARLIAAAPDMLEALRPFAACADELDAEKKWDDEEWAKFRLLVKHYRAARAALAKATGGAA